ncbi:MAG: sulfite exporter TauE/SafE family protein [Chitinophagaceae bacterium]|nr:MAG: sulfite exporter TauE/SafE family protein [Chitinophagaceae bacterium]
MTLQMILILVTIGLMAGMLSGMVGVGGGIIVVPALVFFLGFTQKQAQGTSLALLSLPVVILAALNYYNQGLVEVRTVLVMAVAFLVGGFLGSKIALSVPEESLKRFFAVVLFYTGFKMLGFDVIALLVQGFKKIFG